MYTTLTLLVGLGATGLSDAFQVLPSRIPAMGLLSTGFLLANKVAAVSAGESEQHFSLLRGYDSNEKSIGDASPFGEDALIQEGASYDYYGLKATANKNYKQQDSVRELNTNDADCGGRGRCTNGAACTDDDICLCSPGWLPDPNITLADAGWRSCVPEDECLAPVNPCAAANAVCVDVAPPMRYSCVCPKGKSRGASKCCSSTWNRG